MTSAQDFSASLLASLVDLGVKDFYLAPGSRSQSLAIAAGQLAEAGLARLTVRLDERSMGFMALGSAMGTKRPSVVITTSGTAVANLHPAVLEAHHSGVPLILLTADRPKSLRGKGANQTTNQVGIFADALRDLVDVSVPELGEFDPADLARNAITRAIGQGATLQPGPVQLNLQFQEPLSSAEPNASHLVGRLQPLQAPGTTPSELEVVISDSAVVIAGSQAGEDARKFAEAAGLPLFAEPSSGSRYGDCVITDYPKQLIDGKSQQVKQVFVFGKPTLSRAVMKLIKESETWVQSSTAHGLFDPFSSVLGSAEKLVPVGRAAETWLASWKQHSSKPTRRGKLASLIWNTTSSNEQLLFGASQIIREAENCLPSKEISVFANRGLAGIDGTVSTALGLAQSGSKTRALMGDLTLLHDASGLNTSGLGELNVQLIVGNDGGGEIFRHLEVAQQLDESKLSQLFLTPQQVRLEGLAQAYGWQYFETSSLEELTEVLPKDGLWLIDFQL